ncbi:hypothetical protein SCLCIDRAFT_117031 [Scleroderma citrinum Foug A]|uniref:DUF6532 domain-containing protein n=1 Tax=Scleroderma citrinum Foug A TaxID=1036808 RepID=A0A0C2ZPK1_9AGAM|nr:hypothetical protein SCLCIDRAFT_117031 [Scleroderma citrinum Foug A]
MTWRSTIKAKAHEYIVRHYPLGSTKSCEENLANAQELICGAKFLRDGVEPDGTTKNMASPALAGLILEFFYTGTSALASLFPEVFTQEVPKSVVCLAATAVSTTAIDEYMITGVQQDCPFEYNIYSKIFTQLMGMQAKIDANSKHAAMTQMLRIRWATTGRISSMDGDNMTAGEDDFDVILD